MSGFPICAKSVSHFLASRVKTGRVTWFSKMPWPGDPRVNIQDAGGKAKAYQVRQVLQAIDKLEDKR